VASLWLKLNELCTLLAPKLVVDVVGACKIMFQSSRTLFVLVEEVPLLCDF
jgi:hypothetical protein